MSSFLNVLKIYFLDYAKVNGTFHLIILQILRQCYFWIFSKCFKTSSNVFFFLKMLKKHYPLKHFRKMFHEWCFMLEHYSSAPMGYERFIFWFWESPTTGWHACKVKKTLSLSYNMHLFLPYLLKDYQMIPDSLNDPPLCDANLRWLVDFISISSCL